MIRTIPLAGNHKGEFSLRIGNYRIVYMLDTKEHAVSMLTVNPSSAVTDFRISNYR